MLDWLKNKLGIGAEREARLLAEGEAQRLSLELDECRQAGVRLQQLLESERAAQAARRDAAVEARLAPFLGDLGGPLAHLLSQGHLLESGLAGVQPRDVLLLVRRLVRVLEDHGITLVGATGQVEAFDPGLHEPIGAGPTPQPGSPAVIRFVGLRFGGVVLRKAGVELHESLSPPVEAL